MREEVPTETKGLVSSLTMAFKVNINVCKMVQRRGFILLKSMRERMRNTKVFLEALKDEDEEYRISRLNFTAANKAGNVIYVRYIDVVRRTEKMSSVVTHDTMADINSGAEAIFNGVPVQQIIVIEREPSKDFRSFIEEMSRMGHNITLFLFSELINDPFTHKFSPEYTVLSKEQIKKETDDTSTLQRISVNEPIIKILGLKLGDVVMTVTDFRYTNLLNRERINYRLVVPALKEKTKKTI